MFHSDFVRVDKTNIVIVFLLSVYQNSKLFLFEEYHSFSLIFKGTGSVFKLPSMPNLQRYPLHLGLFNGYGDRRVKI